jgi:hypothetical protein
MAKDLLITVEQDHIESLTRASGINAISELIWNALDADATEIRINYKKNILGKYEELTIEDNGHALDYSSAEEVFKKIGGSAKKQKIVSPNGRSFHGKEGKGRYKAFAIGDLVQFESIYSTKGKSSKININIDRNDLRKPILSDIENLSIKIPSRFKVSIFNVDDKCVNEIITKEGKRELEERFASYFISYPDFKIFINNQELEFESLIKNTFQERLSLQITEQQTYAVVIKIIEWNFNNKKKTYYCSSKGIPFKEGNLGVRASLPISIFIQSPYIEKLHRENLLDIAELDSNLNGLYEEAKKIARKYLRDRLHFYSKEFIESLKRDNLYPYEGDTTEEVEKAKRQVFDIVALNVNEYLPDFNDQDNKTKKFTLRLIKEALENDSNSLQIILSEVIGLPDDKREELKELLETTSLVNIIDTINEVNNRLQFLNAIELLIYDPEHSKKVKERKHLHKILINETWIFGDEHTYGADDITLKNVLKEYLKMLGREDYEEIVSESNNDDLQTIPDVCLWKQFNLGKNDHFENLIIELKKPTVKGGFKELQQIQSYAQKVQKDPRFPKALTKWNFVLLVKDVDEEIEPQLNQQNREYGHVLESENLNVWVLKWGYVIQKARARYKYVKDRLNITFKDNHDALDYLNSKYKQYLPDEFGK